MKRLTMTALAGALACALGASQTTAQTVQNYQQGVAMTGGKLGEFCAAKPDDGLGTAELNLCHGYARGAVATYLALQAGSRYPLKLFCLPPVETISASAVLNEYAAWIKTVPQQAQAQAVDALFAFLGTKFPCGK
jgi:hypothetical protein